MQGIARFVGSVECVQERLEILGAEGDRLVSCTT
jgi:hypothetical protein